MQVKETGMLIVGFILFLIGSGIHIFGPDRIINPSGAGGAFIGAGVALFLVTLREIRLKNKGNVVEDERILHIALRKPAIKPWSYSLSSKVY
ncbi:DUF2178 domain-containing protein [Methanohalophilus euhalobius]|uniref:Putative membrane protein DUF2178 n=1 Tax=Methanohalophilus euhalobius TaxID=51203 RepID=A0A315A1G2_9EURY|nr:DUF2178 domain-containing protein [Methanohalophilus euhalobius]PQV42854.1 putative membrane protein DUF2178 [Methanohalophilus euhalobius]